MDDWKLKNQDTSTKMSSNQDTSTVTPISSNGFRHLFSSEHWLTTVLVWYYHFFDAFSMYGVLLIAPSIVSGEVQPEF